MTISIAYSLYVREMFRFKQISSHFFVVDVFRMAEVFLCMSVIHFSVIIDPILAPAPRPSPTPPNPTPPSTKHQWAL